MRRFGRAADRPDTRAPGAGRPAPPGRPSARWPPRRHHPPCTAWASTALARSRGSPLPAFPVPRGRSPPARPSATIVTPSRSNSSGGTWRREEGEAAMVARRAYRALSGVRRASACRVRAGAGPGPCARLSQTICVTPRGREAGEIPAQSRYGERSSGSASPVADPTVHARTFERKVGRTVRPTG